jgi:hypothetical protein
MGVPDRSNPKEALGRAQIKILKLNKKAPIRRRRPKTIQKR